jgi:hypothetical protein
VLTLSDAVAARVAWSAKTLSVPKTWSLDSQKSEETDKEGREEGKKGRKEVSR